MLPQPPRTRLSRAVREFLHAEAAGGIVLLVGAAVALVWANSPWDAAYDTLWHTELTLELGRWSISEDLQHWVNDALMAVFFFVVGLEIKRELVVGELRDPRTAALPAVAALGGMIVPAALFLAVTAGTDAADGWGIPMATDIAFAVGVVALLGPRVPASLKLFLLTLAIVDDIGAIVVIAAFYSAGLEAGALAVAVGLLALTVLLRRRGVQNQVVFVVLALGVWLATYQSGVHATIAGVALGLVTPARPVAPTTLAKEWAGELSEDPSPEDLRSIGVAARAGVSVAERLQTALHPVSSFVIIPIFALANAGVRLDASAFDGDGTTRLALAVVVGLVIGKLVGIFGATWLAVRSGLGRLPADAAWGDVAGIGAVAGIGFTVSIFVTGLAYESAELQAAGKIGVLAASTIAAVIGSVLLVLSGRSMGDDADHEAAPTT